MRVSVSLMTCWLLTYQANRAKLCPTVGWIEMKLICQSVCVCVCLWRCTVPEQWSACVKDTLHASRAERDKTARMCAQIKELLRESTNEIWQHANIATNALSANIDRIQREKATSIDRLALVRAIISTIHCVRKKVTPCVLFYNSGKWFRILTTFCSNNAASNCKQTAKFQ